MHQHIEIKLQSATVSTLPQCEQELNRWANDRARSGYEIRDPAICQSQDGLVILTLAVLPGTPPPTTQELHPQPAAEDGDAPVHINRTESTSETDNPKLHAPGHSDAYPDPSGVPHADLENDHSPTDPASSSLQHDHGQIPYQDDLPEQELYDRAPPEQQQPDAPDPLEALFPPAQPTAPQPPLQAGFLMDLYSCQNDSQDNCELDPPPQPDAAHTATDWQINPDSGVSWRRYALQGTGQVGRKKKGTPGYWWRIIGHGGRNIIRGDVRTTDEGRKACDAYMQRNTATLIPPRTHQPSAQR